NLGNTLVAEGRLEEALAAYGKAAELGDAQAASLRQAGERLRALWPRLPGLAAGSDGPADNAERLAFAELCPQPGARRYALARRRAGGRRVRGGPRRGPSAGRCPGRGPRLPRRGGGGGRGRGRRGGGGPGRRRAAGAGGAGASLVGARPGHLGREGAERFSPG